MFWDLENSVGTDEAFFDVKQQKSISYQHFKKDSNAFVETVTDSRKKLAFVFCDSTYASVLAYISLLRAGHAVFLVDAKIDHDLGQRLIEIYHPDFIWGVFPEIPYLGFESISPENPYLWTSTQTSTNPIIHPELAVLLSTSGTTGSPKLVRLSYGNIQSNAESIAAYLQIAQDERTISTLPFHYSFGLSVLNSYLQAGAQITCSDEAVVTRSFWKLFKEQKCTSLAGVPFSYKMLKRLHFEQMELPSLRVMTQAGGALEPKLIEYFGTIAEQQNFRFYVMYGQTEASPRISYVPPERLLEKQGSIGIPIPGGTLSLRDAAGNSVEGVRQDGELVYRGPNVMMGYAEQRSDLEKGDEQQGTLFTGDLAYRDEDDYFYITGRLKRMLKIFGLRLNLDEAEQMLTAKFEQSVACTGEEDVLMVFIESEDDSVAEVVKAHVQNVYHIHHTGIKVYCVPALAYTSSGKKNYQALKKGVKNEYN